MEKTKIEKHLIKCAKISGYFEFIYNRFYIPYCLEHNEPILPSTDMFDLIENDVFKKSYVDILTKSMKQSISKIVEIEIENNGYFVWNFEFNDISL